MGFKVLRVERHRYESGREIDVNVYIYEPEPEPPSVPRPPENQRAVEFPISIIDAIICCEPSFSRGHCRRLCRQGGVAIHGMKLVENSSLLGPTKLRVGKKVFDLVKP